MRHSAGTVSYVKDGEVVYTSQVRNKGTLYLGASLKERTASLANVTNVCPYPCDLPWTQYGSTGFKCDVTTDARSSGANTMSDCAAVARAAGSRYYWFADNNAVKCAHGNNCSSPVQALNNPDYTIFEDPCFVSPPTPAPSSPPFSAEGYVCEADKRMPGDLVGGSTTVEDAIADCEQLCSAAAECVGFVYNAADTCYLKAEVMDRIEQDGTTTCLKQFPSPPTPSPTPYATYAPTPSPTGYPTPLPTPSPTMSPTPLPPLAPPPSLPLQSPSDDLQCSTCSCCSCASCLHYDDGGVWIKIVLRGEKCIPGDPAIQPDQDPSECYLESVPAWRCGSGVIEFGTRSNFYSYSVEGPLDNCLHVAPSPPPLKPQHVAELFDYDSDLDAQLVPNYTNQIL